MSDNAARVRRLVDEVINAGKMSTVDELVADDVVARASASSEPQRGKQAMKEFVTRLRQGLPDLHWTVQHQIADGDYVATVMTWSYTHTASLIGLEPSGRPVKTEAVLVDRFRDGMLVETTAFNDQIGMLQQVGAFPHP